MAFVTPDHWLEREINQWVFLFKMLIVEKPGINSQEQRDIAQR